MSNALRITLTPNHKEPNRIIGNIEVDREDELPAILNAGGYLKVTQDNEKVKWVNLANILKVEESPKGETPTRVRRLR